MKNIFYCFPQGKHKVLTMSYDDGREADRRLIEIFNKYGIKGSFHLNSGLLGIKGASENRGIRIPSEEFSDLYKGHEVSAHTVTHPTIERCPIEQVVYQVIEDRKNLEEVMKYPVRGLSYPNGSFSQEIKEILPGIGIEYGRTVNSTGSFQMPEDYLEWNPTCHHNKNLKSLGEEFIYLNKTQYLYMMYVWGHSYEFDEKDNWEVIEEFCQMISSKEDIWYATNIQIVHYMKAAKNLIFSANGKFVYNPSYISVWISYDGKIKEIEGGKTVILEK